MDALLSIGGLQQKRYDATCSITQLREKISDIEKHELNLMKESTIQHSKLQKHYSSSTNEHNYIKEIAVKVAQRLGCMKYNLRMLNEQVQMEHHKLDELDELLDKLSKCLEESNDEGQQAISSELISVEEQRDSQAKVFEDLEFRELETQSRYEDESERLKGKLFETLRRFLLLSKDREDRKLVLDDQQIRLMKGTRKALDNLEEESSRYSEQILYYENVIQVCNTKIAELNRLLNVPGSQDAINRSLCLIDQNGRGSTANYLSDISSNISTRPFTSSPSNVNIVTDHNLNLHDKLEVLTEIVRLQLNMKSDLSVDTWLSKVNPCALSQGEDPNFHSSTLSVLGVSKLVSTNPTIASSIPSTSSVTIDSTSSSMSPLQDSESSKSNVDSNTSNNEHNLRTGSETIVALRGNDENIQPRPRTWLLQTKYQDYHLRQYIESCGHDLLVCGNKVQIDKDMCQGFLWKSSNSFFNVYRKRWFCFDHSQRELRYYSTKSKHKLKGVISFQSICDVFVDHLHGAKRPKKLSFCIETQYKTLYLVASKSELVSLWVDVIFTGAEGNVLEHASEETRSALS